MISLYFIYFGDESLVERRFVGPGISDDVMGQQSLVSLRPGPLLAGSGLCSLDVFAQAMKVNIQAPLSWKVG